MQFKGCCCFFLYEASSYGICCLFHGEKSSNVCIFNIILNK